MAKSSKAKPKKQVLESSEEELNRTSMGAATVEESENLKLTVEDNVSQETLDLRARVAQLEQEKADRQLQAENLSDESQYIKELEALRRKPKAGGLNEIKYKEINPEMISLWHVSGHNVGKRVGPLVLEQAEETFIRFRKEGIRLSSTKPSDQWIENYKKTTEYKAAADKESLRRAGKSNTRKESEVEKLTKAVATMSGIAADKVNKIITETDVKQGKSADMLNQFAKV